VTLNPDQFGEQGELWPRSEIDALDTAARRNTAESGLADPSAPQSRRGVKIRGEATRERYLDHMGNSKATREDLHEIEHSGPTVELGAPEEEDRGSAGWYNTREHTAKVSSVVQSTPDKERVTLYHELGHAVHIDKQNQLSGDLAVYERSERGRSLASPRLEGVADGYADRLFGSEIHSSYEVSSTFDDWSPEGRWSYSKTRRTTRREGMPSLASQVKETKGLNSRPVVPRGQMQLFPRSFDG
jgi:hypothetical protein